VLTAYVRRELTSSAGALEEPAPPLAAIEPGSNHLIHRTLSHQRLGA
jgi:hypothetical protein